MMNQNSKVHDPSSMTREEFIQIRKMTGCSPSAFAKCFPITAARITAYERKKEPRNITPEDAQYMRRIQKLYGGAR